MGYPLTRGTSRACQNEKKRKIVPRALCTTFFRSVLANMTRIFSINNDEEKWISRESAKVLLEICRERTLRRTARIIRARANHSTSEARVVVVAQVEARRGGKASRPTRFAFFSSSLFSLRSSRASVLRFWYFYIRRRHREQVSPVPSRLGPVW